MNQFDDKIRPAFFITEAAPCPYIEGQKERKLFTHLAGDNAEALNYSLSRAGFRRSQNIAYRPACDFCQACQSSRVMADRFTPTANFRRILWRNEDVTRTVTPASASREQYDLLRSYIDARHEDGGMADMTSLHYIEMVEETTVDTHLVEYRLADGRLIACLICDTMPDGLSMVYSFFDPLEKSRSLGSFLILDQIQRAQHAGQPFVYLGYLIEDCQKMAYKKRFRTMQCLGKDGWTLYN